MVQINDNEPYYTQWNEFPMANRNNEYTTEFFKDTFDFDACQSTVILGADTL